MSAERQLQPADAPVAQPPRDADVSTEAHEQLRTISVAEFASRLGVSVRTFHRWRHMPEVAIPAPLQLPGHTRWEAVVADEFIRDLRARPRKYFRSARHRRGKVA